MTTLGIELKDNLWDDTNSEFLFNKSESVISILAEMLVNSKKITNKKHNMEVYCCMWKYDSISNERYKFILS